MVFKEALFLSMCKECYCLALFETSDITKKDFSMGGTILKGALSELNHTLCIQPWAGDAVRALERIVDSVHFGSI